MLDRSKGPRVRADTLRLSRASCQQETAGFFTHEIGQADVFHRVGQLQLQRGDRRLRQIEVEAALVSLGALSDDADLHVERQLMVAGLFDLHDQTIVARPEKRQPAVQRLYGKRRALRNRESDKGVVLVGAKLKVRLDAGDLALHFAEQLAIARGDRLLGLLLALELVDLAE